MILVLTGPAGVGKDTLIQLIVAGSGFRRYAAYTTRPARLGEVEGVHYRFVSQDSFRGIFEREKIFDHLQLGGFDYGSSLADFEQFDLHGEDVVLHLATPAAIRLRSQVSSVYLVFVLPPSRSEQVRRLRHRGMSENAIESRLRSDPTDFSSIMEFDYIAVNETSQEQQTAERILAQTQRVRPVPRP